MYLKRLEVRVGLRFPVGLIRGAVVLFAEVVDKRKSECSWERSQVEIS